MNNTSLDQKFDSVKPSCPVEEDPVLCREQLMALSDRLLKDIARLASDLKRANEAMPFDTLENVALAELDAVKAVSILRTITGWLPRIVGGEEC